MWTCGKCNEQVEADFEICWNCGTSRDGVPDPHFQPATDEGVAGSEHSGTPAAEPVTFEEVLAARFHCVKCRNLGAVVRRIYAEPADLLAFTRVRFVSASCTRCSYTEFYSPDVLEGREAFARFADLLFPDR